MHFFFYYYYLFLSSEILFFRISSFMRFLAGVKLPKVHSAIYCAGVVCVCLFVFSALLTLWCTSVINFFFQNCRSHHFIGMVRNSKTFMAFVKKKKRFIDSVFK